jgi:hypothetical protein
MPGTGANRDKADRQWRHRQALHIVGLLPDDMADAIAILDRAKFLLEAWQMGPEADTADKVTELRPRLVAGD